MALPPSRFASPDSAIALLSFHIPTLFSLVLPQDKGANGGILTNRTVICLVSVQILLWFQAERVSRLVADIGKFPEGKRRPHTDSFLDKVIGWLVENGAVWTLCNLRSLLPHPTPVVEWSTQDLYSYIGEKVYGTKQKTIENQTRLVKMPCPTGLFFWKE
jgi:hypothetical protein